MVKAASDEKQTRPIDPSQLKGRRFGRVLTKLGKVTREQVHEALALQRTRKQKGQENPIGEVLVELGYIEENDVLAALAGQAGMLMIEVDPDEIPSEAVEALPPETANTYQIIPIEFDSASRRLRVAMKSPDNFRAVDDLRLLMGFKVEAVVAPVAQIDAVLKKHYSGDTGSMATMMAELGEDESLAALQGRGESIDLEELASAAEDNKVVRLLNLVLLQAIKDKASDIHFEPFEAEFKMRYRIDGILYEMVPPPQHLALPIVSRIKVMANLDIAERRLPQDGRIELVVNNNPIDLRISVLPTMFGESVVMRVLDRSNVQLSLDKIGLRDDELEHVRTLIRKPNGIIVVTGPTGSGKTTTLYAGLNELNEPTTKILTAEDPVEYDIDGLIQCQINLDQDLTFARLLRSFLRQDPDVILVGEIRDLETAQIAVQASLTGHLVFSTLHTNDAPSSVLRLLDLGMDAFLLTATIEAIVGQRLVRRICLKCKEEYVPTDEELMELQLKRADVEGRTFYRGRGCEDCNHSGFRGRRAIFEVMQLDDQLRELIMQETSTNVLRAEARRRGMRTLREAGLLAIYEGQTTIDEVVRETIIEEQRIEGEDASGNGANRVMPTYQYEALNSAGKPQKGTVEATSSEEAIQRIKGQGYFPTSVREQKVKGETRTGGGATVKKKKKKTNLNFAIGGVGQKKLTLVTRQMSTLQDAGLPLLRSIQILEQQQRPGLLKSILGQVAEDVEAGSTLSDAMGKHPKAFDRLYCKMINAGEIGGVLDVILQRLAIFMEKAQRLRRRIIGAMIYPITVIFIAVIIVTGIMYFVIPKFQDIFEDFEVELPALTIWLTNTSAWVAGKAHPDQAIPGAIWILVSPIVIFLLFKLIRLTDPGRAVTDIIRIKMPIVGGLMRKTAVARFTRTLGTLIAAGVPILEAIMITRDTAGNYVYEQALTKVHDSIREGESFAGPLREAKVCDPIVVNMIDVGEETGDLDTMLMKIADNYDEEVDVAVQALISLLEPLLVVLLGGIVGTIVLALFLPLVKMIESVSGGKL